MKCLGRKLFPSKHDIFCFSSWDYRENECVESLDFFFFFSLVCHIDLCCSRSDSPVCFSRGGSSWNISLILLMKTSFTSDMSAVLVKRLKPLSSLQRACEQAVVADDGFKK